MILLSYSFLSPFFQHPRTVPQAPTTIGITVTFVPHLFQPSGKIRVFDQYFTFFHFKFTGTENSAIWHIFSSTKFTVVLLLRHLIMWSVCIEKSERIFGFILMNRFYFMHIRFNIISLLVSFFHTASGGILSLDSKWPQVSSILFLIPSFHCLFSKLLGTVPSAPMWYYPNTVTNVTIYLARLPISIPEPLLITTVFTFSLVFSW